MINAKMKQLPYYAYGSRNSIGEETLSSSPLGFIKISIHLTSQSIQDNINYKDCNYVGFTQDTKVDDTYVIEYEGERLKVLYVNPNGRFKQVFLARM